MRKDAMAKMNPAHIALGFYYYTAVRYAGLYFGVQKIQQSGCR